MPSLHVYTARLATSLKHEWRKSALLGFIFLLFISNALGLVHFGRDLLETIDFTTAYVRRADGSLTVPAIATSLEFFVLLASGVVLIIFLPLLNPITASILVFVLAIPPVWIAIAFPYRYNTVPMQFSLLVLLVLFSINVLMKYFSETRNKQELLDTFSQYLPPQVVKQLSQQSNQIVMGGESRFVTVMFCDLRNFTGLSERLKPQQVVQLLNSYFTAMTEVLFQYGATIDKYMGDSIMAFWGAPLAQDDQVERAVQASFEMHRKLGEVASQFHALNLPTPSIGIGINSGTVNVGNMGSRHRLTYTVIGDAVNLAFRLQTATRDYEVGTIVGESTAERFPAMQFRELDQVKVRGKTQATRIYEPLCLKSEMTPALAQQVELHQRAMASMYGMQGDEPLALFNDLARRYPEQPYYRAMLNKLSQATPFRIRS